ncbi:hypothetical protein [Mucilaginibacter celer]|uniref:5'-Nucleotidase C-terminal domain-containing protein n=1 Tax=Mucilaginibacter celer TaxID=2305508 RepID=A0A494W4E7_9SPHI|nr:hypothetical protein [Mucilaginibacter celer]AYL98633.1 hypothetical protein HYN43_026650 [Mucilaginibacter celer]
MKKTLIALLALLNRLAALAQTTPNKTILQSSMAVKPVLQTRLDTLDKQRDTAKKAAPAVTDPADTLYRHLPGAAECNALLIINDKIIARTLDINPQDVSFISVLKDKNIPKNLFNNARYGLVRINLKRGIKIDAIRLPDLKKLYTTKGKVKFALNGYFIDDESLLIEKKALIRIDQIRDNYWDPLSAVTINIWTVNPDMLRAPTHDRRPTDKPGEIYIRGLASK